MPPKTPAAAAWAGFLYGAGSVGDLAGARLPDPGPIRPSGGFAADIAKLNGDARRLAGDGRRTERAAIPADGTRHVAANG